MSQPTPAVASQHFLSQDVDETSAFIAAHLVTNVTRPLPSNSSLSYETRFVVGDAFHASRGRMPHGMEIETLAGRDLIMVYIGFDGAVSVEAPGRSVTGTRETIVASSARTVERVVFSERRDEIFIAVGADSVRGRIRDLTGRNLGKNFDFHRPIDVGSALGSALAGFGTLLHGALDGDPLLQSSPIGLRRHKDAFIDLMLHAIGMDKIADLAGPRIAGSGDQVVRAEEFMRASADQPIGIGDVAAHLGITVRALQYAFRRKNDTTPLAMLQQIRLEGVRTDLAGRPPQAIAEVAARWGFTNRSRFSQQYHLAFGERPSDTAKRNQAVAPSRTSL